MMCACASGQLSIAQYLHSNCGVDLNGSMKSSDGEEMSFLSAACMYAASSIPDSDDILNTLVMSAPDADVDELIMHASDLMVSMDLLQEDEQAADALKIVQWMLESGCEVVHTDRDGYTPFALVCLSGCLPIAQILLEYVGRGIERAKPAWHSDERVRELMRSRAVKHPPASQDGHDVDETKVRLVVGVSDIAVGQRVLKCFEVFDDEDDEHQDGEKVDDSWFEGEVHLFDELASLLLDVFLVCVTDRPLQ